MSTHLLTFSQKHNCLPLPKHINTQPHTPHTQFGYEDFLLKLTGPNGKIATSKLGLGYAKGPGNTRSLFAPSEGDRAEIVDLKVYVVKGR